MAIAVGVAFTILRQIELWLHQHIFKVGWLVTKNFRTTTILYYTFFLPGIVVYELTIWLAAGAFDVRADRAIEWPEPQEIGELRLNFVQLARRTSAWKVQVINLSPLVTGMAIIWWIGIKILNLPDITEIMGSGGPGGFVDGIKTLTRTTDFWLWAYFLFTIGNTILPEPGIFKNWRWLAVATFLIVLPFFLLGVEDQVVGGAITGPIASILNVMLIVFGVIIVFNALGVMVLSAIENTIEYITGDSATFKNGKMVVMTREEAMAEKKRARENARRRQGRAATASPALSQGPPSIYRLEFPIPGGPGKEPISSITTSLVEPEAESTPRIAGGGKPRFAEPSIITQGSDDEDRQVERSTIRFGGSSRSLDASDDGNDEQNNDEVEESIESRPQFTPRSSFPAPEVSDSVIEDEDEEDNESEQSLPSGLRPRPSPFGSSQPESDRRLVGQLGTTSGDTENEDDDQMDYDSDEA